VRYADLDWGSWASHGFAFLPRTGTWRRSTNPARASTRR
jgi:hypothetical protein